MTIWLTQSSKWPDEIILQKDGVQTSGCLININGFHHEVFNTPFNRVREGYTKQIPLEVLL